MVTMYPNGIYFEGESIELGPGSHFDPIGARSMRIGDGYTVQFFENYDTSGKRSRLFYTGGYEDLSCYGNVGGYKRFDILKTDLRNEDFITTVDYIDVGTGVGYPKKLKVPVGDWRADQDDWWNTKFGNNQIDIIEVPTGTVVRLYDDPDSNNFIEFYGECWADLHRLEYNNKVSRIVVEKDSWEVIEDVVDWDNIKELSRERITGNSGTIRNSSDASFVQKFSLSFVQEDTYTRKWEIGGSLTAGASVTASGGVPLVGNVSVTASVSATVSASASGTDTTTVSTQKKIESEVHVPPNTGVEVLAIYDKIKSTIPTYRMLRNKRTGASMRQDADLIAYQGTDADVNMREVPIE